MHDARPAPAVFRHLCLLVAGAALTAGVAGILPGCQTARPGVRSAFGSQYAILEASVEEATQAAVATLEAMELREITATSTPVDGEVTAFTADRTRVEVYVATESPERTEVSVMVGALGDATIGTAIIASIQERLSGPGR